MRIKSFTVILSAVLLLIPLANFGCGGGGGKIAYTEGAHLYVMNWDGTEQTKLVDYAMGANMSRDGTKVVYSRSAYPPMVNDEDEGIYVIGTDGQNEHRLSNRPVTAPKWSPDGKRIAITSQGIGIMDADGSNLKTVKPAEVIFENPVWSPDGSRFACIVHGRQDGQYKNGLYTMNTDGSNLRLVLEADPWIWQPSWSPNGRQLAYLDEYKAVCIVNTDGSGKKVLVTNTDIDASGGTLESPVWSPGGKQLAFSYRSTMDAENRVFSIYTINSDGTGLTKIGDFDKATRFLSWSR